MKIFNGNCPECDSEFVEYTSFEWETDWIIVKFECEKCWHKFQVNFTKGIIVEKDSASDE